MSSKVRKLNPGMTANDYLQQQILVWLHLTQRRLTLWELQQAVSIRPCSNKLKVKDIPSPELMQTVTNGMMNLDTDTGDISLIGGSSIKYLKTKLVSWLINADTEIARACITFMRYEYFENGPAANDEAFEARMKANPFYEYAVCFWGHHVRRATTKAEKALAYKANSDSNSPENPDQDPPYAINFCFEEYNTLQKEVEDFLQGGNCFLAASQAILAMGAYRGKQVARNRVMVVDRPVFAGYSQNTPQSVTGVHIAAWFGLTSVIRDLIKTGHDPDAKTSNGRTPLSLAASHGYNGMVALLVDRYGANLETRSNCGLTPLNYAACEGHAHVVRHLIDIYGVDIESVSNIGRTALVDAAGNGHDEVVRVLLGRGANMDTTDNVNHQTALIFAVIGNHEEIVRLLVMGGANVDATDDSGRTALGHAAELGYEAIAKLLYYGSYRSPKPYGRRPLSNFARLFMRDIAEIKATW